MFVSITYDLWSLARYLNDTGSQSAIFHKKSPVKDVYSMLLLPKVFRHNCRKSYRRELLSSVCGFVEEKKVKFMCFTFSKLPLFNSSTCYTLAVLLSPAKVLTLFSNMYTTTPPWHLVGSHINQTTRRHAILKSKSLE